MRLHNNAAASLRYRADVARAIAAYRMALRTAWLRLGRPSSPAQSHEFAAEGAKLFEGLKAQIADYGRTLELQRDGYL